MVIAANANSVEQNTCGSEFLTVPLSSRKLRNYAAPISVVDASAAPLHPRLLVPWIEPFAIFPKT
jgi:hypothetical protein